MAPITASVARVALRGSDSNHRDKILVAGEVKNSYNTDNSLPSEPRDLAVNQMNSNFQYF
jgi:hypothetical protein